MSDIAVKVENLGKLYRLGAQQVRHNSLRDALVFGFKRLASKRNSVEGEQNLWALKDVSFEVKHGEVVGIIGRNGAGKSTLLKVLAHITEPTTGRVSIYGRVGSLLEVGTGFHPELTGRDNIYMYGAILGMKRAEIQRKFDEIVAFAEIEKFLDTPVKRYSSGMYVRLAFAVAAHLEPEILLVDEVLSVGDALFQKKSIGKMNDIARQGRTGLFVSHNLQAVMSFCPKGMLLSSGSLIFNGSSTDAVAQYTFVTKDDLILEQDIENKPRRPGEGSLVRITRIALSFPSGSSAIWEPLQFDMQFKCLSADHSFALSVEVWKLVGTCAFTTDSEDDGMTIDADEITRYKVSIRIDNPNLPPDRYVVRAVARSGGRVIDWINEALVFDITASNNVSMRVSERHLGHRVHGKWNALADRT